VYRRFARARTRLHLTFHTGGFGFALRLALICLHRANLKGESSNPRETPQHPAASLPCPECTSGSRLFSTVSVVEGESWCTIHRCCEGSAARTVLVAQFEPCRPSQIKSPNPQSRTRLASWISETEDFHSHHRTVQERLARCKLEVHPSKTKIVYCQDSNRRASYLETSFEFLSFHGGRETDAEPTS